ncbi:hypothetical protein [Paenibacillus sp. SYP-B4298]|uniref:hypothetical protein n=1 Tax=Paenibacillus sp. SYP-B4298 TaxID=2996034 RepID=UPI0022DE8419|nr:hypothetical protein [Paenibacillus sp. SYP-B4298]
MGNWSTGREWGVKWRLERWMRMESEDGQLEHRLRMESEVGQLEHRLRMESEVGQLEHRLRMESEVGQLEHRLRMESENGQLERWMSGDACHGADKGAGIHKRVRVQLALPVTVPCSASVSFMPVYSLYTIETDEYGCRNRSAGHSQIARSAASGRRNRG